jgi:ring-1,2-phenylacetyl-CoA epoxidase subunit PaaC
MRSELKLALCDKLLALADDEMILAHRNSEWTGHGPILEEDIAFSNIAQDEMGHASLWYGLLQELTGRRPDQMVFFRDPVAFRNVQMMELPTGDWAFSMLRQYLFDTAEMTYLAFLVHSSYQPIADVAAKIRQEEIYHLRHTSNWVKRLGLGTEESNLRVHRALEALWPSAQQLFKSLPNEALLVDQGIVEDPATFHQRWQETVKPFLTDAGLGFPVEDALFVADRTDHTEHLTALLGEMQMVARLDPAAEW